MQYTVKSGDTLGAISEKFYGTLKNDSLIAGANKLDNPNAIYAGQVLTIPDVGEAYTEDGSSSGDVRNSHGITLLSTEQLQAIMPRAKHASLEKYTPALNNELPKYQIDTPLRMASFIAQIAVESAQLNAVEENLNYSAKALLAVFGRYFPTQAMAERYARQPEKIADRVYANRMGNGDEASGDGWRYRGRGLIQLTGKDNYRQFGNAVQHPMVEHPDMVATDADYAVAAACWYWDSRNLNRFADEDDCKKITRLINGGYHGLAERESFLAKAKQVMVS